MTEAEYLASEDPAAMLAWLSDTRVARGFQAHKHDGQAYNGGPSDRKLLLLHEAWKSPLCGDERYTMGMHHDGSILAECRFELINITQGYKPTAAHLLRDIVGNPWRPVELPLNVKCPGCDGKGGWPSTAGKHGGPGGQTVTACRRCDGEGRLCPWLTLTVVSLAHAAYDHRDPTTGHLDPVRLAVLADALTDAGCDAYGPVVWHLRGRDDLGWHVLNHPHVRGCHVIDRLLGKE